MAIMNLAEIEMELGQLVSSDKKSWVRIYELMEMVEKKELYSPSHRSFTAWVNDFAIKSKVHVSLLWSRKKAGKVYSEYQARAAQQGKAVPDIKEVSVSPDNFVLIEKIAGSNAAVADDLTDKVLAGTLGRSALKNAWATVRTERSNVRVNSHDKPKPDPMAPAVDSSEKAAGEAIPAITAADIVLSLSRPDWVPDQKVKDYQQERYKVMTEFSVDTGTAHHARRIDVLAVENLPRTCLGNRAEELKRIISVNDKLRVCFDFNHSLGEDNSAYIKLLGDKIITTHVSDYDLIDERHWLPGEGKVDWVEMITLMEQADYQGVWMYELGFKAPASIDRRELTWQDFGDNARTIFAKKQPEAIGTSLL